MKKRTTVGSFEAKTHLSELLDEVQTGLEITITKRGKAVAKIIPYKEKIDGRSVEEIIDDFTEIRNSVRGTIKIKDAIREGRKP
jgi:prevent-host-death family protein